MNTILYSITGLAIIMAFVSLLAFKPGTGGKLKRRIARARKIRMQMDSDMENQRMIAIGIGIRTEGFPSKNGNNGVHLTHHTL
jgi:hypothetical protein